MKKSEIVLQYIDITGKEKRGIIKRKEFLERMENFKANYPSNNKISSELVEVIPYIDTIMIDKSRARDTSFIIYVIDKRVFWLDINANHRKIWRCLENYCKQSN